MRKINLQKLQAEVDRWNANVPIGTKVEYVEFKDDKNPKLYTTRTAAEVLSGHTPVVWLNGKAGCVALDHCTPVL